MNLSRLSELTPQQLLGGASALLALLLIAIQFWAFSSSNGSGGVARVPVEVRSSQEKVQALTTLRTAIASRGIADPALIPKRSYVPQTAETAEAIEAFATIAAPAPESAGAASGEGAPAAVAIVPVPPQLKGIVQIRDLHGILRLRAVYPQGSVAAGALVDGYRVKTISAGQVVLVRDGQETVQRVASGAFGSRVL